MRGALLVHKPAGISSFGVIEALQKQWMAHYRCSKRDVPSLGHGGTLDPFATGLLIVLTGPAVKLARYFLGSQKTYEGTLCFGASTFSGDPTEPISQHSEHIPAHHEELIQVAAQWTHRPYLQTPPLHSAKKIKGKPLYEFARAGLHVERAPEVRTLFAFEIPTYTSPRATFKVRCSSGTYIRTLAQDFAQSLGTLAFLETLHRTASGPWHIERAFSLEQIQQATQDGTSWPQLPCWIPFDELLPDTPSTQATPEERDAWMHGQQWVVPLLVKKGQFGSQTPPEKLQILSVYSEKKLIGILRQESSIWKMERTFPLPNP